MNQHSSEILTSNLAHTDFIDGVSVLMKYVLHVMDLLA